MQFCFIISHLLLTEKKKSLNTNVIFFKPENKFKLADRLCCNQALILYVKCEHSELICIYIDHMYMQSNLLEFIVHFP